MGELIGQLSAMFLCVAIAAYAGYRLARLVGRNASVVLAGLLAAAMLLYGQHLTDSIFIARIIPGRILPVFGNLQPILAGLLAGVCWVISPRSAPMKVAVLGVLPLAAMYLPYRYLFEERPTVASIWDQGVCLQTTDATCGAAAAATALRAVGIPATEHEMVDLCFTTWRGTTMHGIIRGLTLKTEGTPWKVRVTHTTPEYLAGFPGPAILRVGLEGDALPADIRYVRDWGWVPGVSHTVVLFNARSGGMLDIGDPATGREPWDREALNVLWQGVAIVLEPRDK